MPFKYKKILYFGLFILFVAAGSLVANVIYSYQVLVSGILGIAVLYLMFRKDKSIKDDPIEYLLSGTITEKVRTILSALAWGFVYFLSVMVILKMLTTLYHVFQTISLF